MYSACGQQVDVFELDEGGALREQGAVQSCKLRADGERHNSALQMDFGGLRHGGHVNRIEYYRFGKRILTSPRLRAVISLQTERNFMWPTCKCKVSMFES